MNDAPGQHDWRPTASWENLRRRAELLARLRQFFARAGFLEVDTPLLSADTVVDRHLDPFRVPMGGSADAAADSGRVRWLQTSPEFAMKRLMAAGGQAIYQVAHAFRRDESGALHNPEFTLVEWYRRDDTMHDGIQLLSELCHDLLARGEAARLSYRDAFWQHAGVDPHRATCDELAAVAAAQQVPVPATISARDRDAWLDLLLVTLVEPHLGRDRPTIVYDYPASQAALARVRPDDPPVAERFELYVDGIELANGYHELLDADALAERQSANNAARAADGKPRLPEDSRLLAAMRHGLPECTGVALGFDRVVMLACGARRLADVLAFPLDRA